MTTKPVLCDADFLIALFITNEPNYELANTIFDKYDKFFVLNITFYEVATVLSRKLIQSEAIETLSRIRESFVDIIKLSDEDEVQSFELYNSFTKKNISFFDCACLVIANNKDYKIASFDKFYPLELVSSIN